MSAVESSDWYQEWLSQRSAEAIDGEVFCLPNVEISVQVFFGLSAGEQKAEQRLRTLCSDMQAIGHRPGSDKWIRYPFLMPSIKSTEVRSQSDLIALGWEQHQVGALPALTQKANDIDFRLAGVAGRLIADPEFLKQRDELRTLWNAVPQAERPEFPLRRTREATAPPPGFQKMRANSRLARFLVRLDEFCDRWQVFELATWNLPLPDGPHWPRLLPAATADTSQSTTVLQTPVRFGLRSDDGTGKVHQQEHEMAKATAGIDDVDSWNTCARLLKIDHWERVLRTRYSGRQRPQNHIMLLSNIIADESHLDGERVTKLRKLLNSLKAGRRTSLRNWR